MNNIESEKRNEGRAWKAEKEKLMEDIRQKDHEIQSLREKQEIANQISQESGIQLACDYQASERIRELEFQINKRQAELQGRELETVQDGAGLLAANQGAFNDDDSFIQDFDEGFDAEMTEMFFSTPTHRAFPSPPDSTSNTPSKVLGIDVGIQATAGEPEKAHLESQLETLKYQVCTLTKALEASNSRHERLTIKLSPYMSDGIELVDNETLDAALDSVITQLALAQSSAAEINNRFSVLSGDLSSFFSTSSCPDPEAIIQLLGMQFRQARLDLEYLSPGENPEGFENTKLLSMLISRLQVLTEKVARQDSSIDEYHEQEISLRQQLGSHVDAVTYLHRSLADAQSSVSKLESELEDRDSSISKLNNALQGYRDEVANLETLISRVEAEHTADIAVMRDEVESTQKATKERLCDADLERDKLAAVAEGHEILIRELQCRLEAAQFSMSEMRIRVEKLTKEKEILEEKMTSMEVSVLERKREHSEALALRDSQVAQLEAEVERLNAQVKVESKRVGLIVTDMEGWGAMMTERARSLRKCEAAVDETSENGYDTRKNIPREPSFNAPGSSKGMTGKKRKRYDSGLGFLAEEDEMGC